MSSFEGNFVGSLMVNFAGKFVASLAISNAASFETNSASQSTLDSPVASLQTKMLFHKTCQLTVTDPACHLAADELPSLNKLLD